MGGTLIWKWTWIFCSTSREYSEVADPEFPWGMTNATCDERATFCLCQYSINEPHVLTKKKKVSPTFKVSVCCVTSRRSLFPTREKGITLYLVQLRL
jgi:hypothetical protein